MKSWLPLLVTALLLGGIIGYHLRSCPEPLPITPPRELDSLRMATQAALLDLKASERRTAEQQRVIDSLLSHPIVIPQAIHDAYARLHLPVQHLADSLLADPK